MSVDFPRGWQIARSAPFGSHDPACSFVQAAGGMLCDCAVLLRHPEYLDDEMHGGARLRPPDQAGGHRRR